jgi:hypothetical protein
LRHQIDETSPYPNSLRGDGASGAARGGESPPGTALASVSVGRAAAAGIGAAFFHHLEEA